MLSLFSLCMWEQTYKSTSKIARERQWDRKNVCGKSVTGIDFGLREHKTAEESGRKKQQQSKGGGGGGGHSSVKPFLTEKKRKHRTAKKGIQHRCLHRRKHLSSSSSSSQGFTALTLFTLTSQGPTTHPWIHTLQSPASTDNEQNHSSVSDTLRLSSDLGVNLMPI